MYDQFPKARSGHSFHIVGETLILWGGCYLDIKCFNDLYMFDLPFLYSYAYFRVKTWTYPKIFGDPPSARTGHSSFMNGAKLYIFGGTTQKGLMSDLHIFDLESVSDES